MLQPVASVCSQWQVFVARVKCLQCLQLYRNFLSLFVTASAPLESVRALYMQPFWQARFHQPVVSVFNVRNTSWNVCAAVRSQVLEVIWCDGETDTGGQEVACCTAHTPSKPLLCVL